MNGLESIIKKIGDASDLECQKIKADADAEISRISEEYAEKTAAFEAETSERFEREAEALITRAKSSSAMKRRNIIVGKRAENVGLAYEKALEFLRSLPRDRYAELLIDLSVSALKNHSSAAAKREQLYNENSENAACELVFNSRDREELGEYCVFTIKNSYKKELGSDILRRLSLSDDTADIDGGVIVRRGNVEENCSFSLMIEDMKSKLDPIIYKTLYPEL